VLADWFLVAARGPAGQHQFLVPSSAAGVSVTSRRSHDITQRFASVDFEEVELDHDAVVGDPAGTADDLECQLQLALVLSVAETVGAIGALFDMTSRYAIDRIAFGRPIGSFQAVKHQLADMSLSVEAGVSIAAAATRAVQAGQADGGEIASMAKAWVGDTGIDVAQGCFQVFGGIGYTWEHDLHLFLRRITMNSLLYGQPDWHRERICEIHGL
jgi:alkylation response protein AidB-like acyl-CoA dehydrogenase